ncbi:MAG: hypothetical protein ICV68_15400 [Pyrinomonadaceae bacterium]|nr:hypothetical protein [Pyrinomonadaceae bacterium]
MAFVVGKDLQDENRRVVASTKNNLAKPPKSLMFELEEAEGGAVHVNWLGQSEVSAKDLLATPQDQEHADARSEAVEFLNEVLANGAVPASQVKEEAEDAGVSERTLKRAKKVVGVVTYRENEAGEGRGTGRWMWKLPVVELVEEDGQGGHTGVQGGQGGPKENVGPLERKKGTETRELGLDKVNVQGGQGLSSRGPSVQGGQPLQGWPP